MNKIFKAILIATTLFNIHFVCAKELCDCFGDCVQIYQRNVSKETKILVKKRYGYPAYARLDIDHKIPLCLGGGNNINNLQVLSRFNHKIKTEHDLILLENVYSCIMTIRDAQEKASEWKIINKKPHKRGGI